MGYNATVNDLALGNGGAGTPDVWDIITLASHDFTGKIVAAFMSMDENGGTFTAMQEETTMGRAGKTGTSTNVAANKLAYTYPQYIPFEGRFTTLVPTTGCTFKVWFLK
jgi:hypothetical protein